jgi:hypothetical protein
VFYRILKAPPGYGPDQNYLVAIYETLDYDSMKRSITKQDGSKFAATREEARNMIPRSAIRLPFEPEYQFLELWEG